MKVTKGEPKFRPVTIELSSEEVQALVTWFAKIRELNASDTRCLVAIELYQEIAK